VETKDYPELLNSNNMHDGLPNISVNEVEFGNGTVTDNQTQL